MLSGVEGKLVSIRTASPTATDSPQKQQSLLQSMRPPVFFLELGRCATPKLRPVVVSHRKRGAAAAASGLWQVPHPVSLKGA